MINFIGICEVDCFNKELDFHVVSFLLGVKRKFWVFNEFGCGLGWEIEIFLVLGRCDWWMFSLGERLAWIISETKHRILFIIILR